MSQWTHIAGCIRIDAILPTEDFKTSLYYKFSQPPEGTEGPIQYKITRTGEENDLAWGLIYIWGDLRDFNQAQEIFKWIKVSCQELFIRSCIVKIDVEFSKSYIIIDKNGELEMQDL